MRGTSRVEKQHKDEEAVNAIQVEYLYHLKSQILLGWVTYVVVCKSRRTERCYEASQSASWP